MLEWKPISKKYTLCQSHELIFSSDSVLWVTRRKTGDIAYVSLSSATISMLLERKPPDMCRHSSNPATSRWLLYTGHFLTSQHQFVGHYLLLIACTCECVCFNPCDSFSRNVWKTSFSLYRADIRKIFMSHVSKWWLLIVILLIKFHLCSERDQSLLSTGFTPEGVDDSNEWLFSQAFEWMRFFQAVQWK